MNQLPIPAFVGHYQISFFGPPDVAEIIKQTRKSPRVSPDRAAVAINKAIMRCLERVGPLLASPPFKYAKWAKQLASALSKSLKLVAPNADAGPPNRGDWGDAYSRLFAAGRPPEITNDLLKQRGFHSSLQALDAGLFGLWFLHTYAAHSEQEWRKKFSPRSDRRTADLLMFMWAQEMGELYSALVKAEPPKQPTSCRPFIRFCAEVSTIVIKRTAPVAADDTVMCAFIRTLRKADRKRLANFICKNEVF